MDDVLAIDGEEFFLLRGGCITIGVTFDFEELDFSEGLGIFCFCCCNYGTAQVSLIIDNTCL